MWVGCTAVVALEIAEDLPQRIGMTRRRSGSGAWPTSSTRPRGSPATRCGPRAWRRGRDSTAAAPRRRADRRPAALGAVLRPAADRLSILATLVALTARRIVPLWRAVAIVGRDLVLSGGLRVLRHYGFPPPEVHFLGKAATLNLLYAFPLLLL